MSAIASFAGFFPSIAHRTPVRRRSAVAMADPTAETVGRGLYGVLGLCEAASTGQIKSAYRSLAKKVHPDVVGGKNAWEFLEIQRAYSTLSDPDEKVMYDRSIGRFLFDIRQEKRFRTIRRWETDQCW